MQLHGISKSTFSSYGNRNVWREEKNYNRAHIEIKQLSQASINIIISMVSIWHISQVGKWKLPGITSNWARTRRVGAEPTSVEGGAERGGFGGTMDVQ